MELEGNTLLKNEELEMLVVLQMNRDFMAFMRENYNYLTMDQFGQTVVDEGGSISSVWV